MKIKKGDLVTVISGNEKGKSGRVLKVIPAKSRLIVEKVNLSKHHMRPSAEFPQGGIMEKESPIHISNVMLVCSRCGQATRVRIKKEQKIKLRICKKCGEVIDEPRKA